jgi:hypothetical protein
MTEPADSEEEFGGSFDEAMFGDVGRSQIADVPTEDSVDPASILRLVARFLGVRLTDGARETRNCLFVHCDDLERDRALGAEGAKRHHHLTRAKSYDPFGRIHVVAAGLNEAWSLEFDCDDPEALHGWLAEHGMIQRPAAWIDPADGRLVWFPRGFADEKSALEMIVSIQGEIDASSIEEALRVFYEKFARVPASHPAFWASPPHHVPCKDTETEIQKALKMALDVYFHRDLVIREVPLLGSKIDFVIHQVASGPPKPACVLELKVLREKHHNLVPESANPCPPGVNVTAVDGGIRQSAVARNELGAGMAYLAAFDMRASDDNTIMADAAEVAGQLTVTCRRYFMYNSKQAYRAAATGKPKPTRATAPRRQRSVKRSGA